jgi:dolichol-phosphate mannosyltransferase
MRKIGFPNMPKGGFDSSLTSKKVVQFILDNQEEHFFYQGAMLWTGFKTKYIDYNRLARRSGASKWTFGKKLTFFIDGIMSYSFLPIRIISLIGILISVLGFIFAFLLFIQRIFLGHSIPGWSALMILILVTSGIQMIMLGVIGEYLWRTLAQTRNRPKYIIEKLYE